MNTLKYGGKVWKINDKVVDNDEGFPVPGIKVKFVGYEGNKLRRKLYLESWKPDEIVQPSCVSNDGVTPNSDSLEVQSDTCKNCAHSHRSCEKYNIRKCIKYCKIILDSIDGSHQVETTLSGVNYDKFMVIDELFNGNLKGKKFFMYFDGREGTEIVWRLI